MLKERSFVLFLFLGVTLCLVAAGGGDYPTTPAPEFPPPQLRPSEELGSCSACPWGRPELGRYPNPFNVDTKSYAPVHRGRFFDVYGHWIETRYSEVFWTAQPAVPLPAEVVEKFKGRAISFTGFEVDVVAGGENNETEWSVPEFQVYNHHYCATITGAAAKMTFVGNRAQDSLLKDDTGGRRRRRAFEVHPPEWEPRDLPVTEDKSAGEDNPTHQHLEASTVPTAQNFWQGNGGEHRKSFKHLPRGTGQLVWSPETFVLQPMLINTNNPPKDGQSPRDAFHAAPLPRSSQAPLGANYRTKRVITGFETRTEATCETGGTLPTAAECFQAAARLIGSITSNITSSDAATPAGCFVVSSQVGTEAHFNSDTTSTAQCGAKAGVPVRSLGSAESQRRDLHVKLDLDESSKNATITLVGPADVWFGVGLSASAMADLPYTITVEPPTGSAGSSAVITERKLANHMPGTPLTRTVEVLSDMVGPAPPPPPRKMNHLGTPLPGHDDTGARDWRHCQTYCVRTDKCAAWTFVPSRFTTPYNLEDGICRLRAPVSPAVSSINDSSDPDGFTSNGWIDGMFSGLRGGATSGGQIRTVVLRRPLTGLTKDHFSFDARTPFLSFIEAVGTTPTYQYHGKSRGGGTIMMVEAGAPVCVCKGKTQGGSINGIPWSNNCHQWPDTTILRDHNPSCSIETYGGGMICCHHGIFLLDEDQDIPSPTFRFRMKYRFYYEDPQDPAVQGGVAALYPGLKYQNSFFMFRETEIAHGEYDVPKCAAGTAPQDCVYTVVGNFQIKDAMHQCNGRADVWCSALVTPNATYPQSQFVALTHISPHCHGPACISMEMIDTDTNTTLCYTEPHYGTSDDAMNEAGYAAGIPPCLWGTAEEGLPPPPVLRLDANITVIKKVNSTIKHFGVMGHWQMRAIWAQQPPSKAHAALTQG